MRSFTASLMIAALCLGTPAIVQAQGAAPSQPKAQTRPHRSSAVTRSIRIVDVRDLKPAERSKVDDIISRTGDEDMKSLRKSIDANPQVAAALRARGLNSSYVVAIDVADGVLTMFTRTA